MKRFAVAMFSVLLLGAGCARSSVPQGVPSATNVREQVNGIADAQEVLREQALLLVAAKSQEAVDDETLAKWEARGRAAADLIIAKEYAQAVSDLRALNIEMRASLDN